MILSNNTKTTGDQAEKLTVKYLIKAGLKLVEQNARSAYGEIDIIMRDDQEWVFVEVRYRRSQHYGGGLESVSYHKQRKLIKTAQHYIQSHHNSHFDSCRFDVVELSGELNAANINWIQDAFRAD